MRVRLRTYLSDDPVDPSVLEKWVHPENITIHEDFDLDNVNT